MPNLGHLYVKKDPTHLALISSPKLDMDRATHMRYNIGKERTRLYPPLFRNEVGGEEK
jgi:hypothetical protein